MSFLDLCKAHLAASTLRAVGSAIDSIAKDAETAAKNLRKVLKSAMPPEPEGYNPAPPKPPRATVTVDCEVVQPTPRKT